MKNLLFYLALLSVISAFWEEDMWDCTEREVEPPFTIGEYLIVSVSTPIYRCPYKCFPSRSRSQPVDVEIEQFGKKEPRRFLLNSESGCFYHPYANGNF